MSLQKIEQISGDIKKLEIVASECQTKESRDFIQMKISKKVAKLNSLKAANPEFKMETSKPKPAHDAVFPVNIKISNYGWDQTDSLLTFYLNFEKIAEIHADKTSLTCENNRSFEFVAKTDANKNYIFTLKKLLKDIVPESGSLKVKKDSVIIKFKKAVPEIWSHLTEIEKKNADMKQSKYDIKDKSDPQESLTSLIKQMYDSGDDEMKRMINKSMAESYQKKYQI